MKCPTCKQELDDGVRFCPHDGTPLTETSALKTVTTPTGQRPVVRELELPVVVGGRYRLVEVRGGGGMAKVYRGVDITLEREVAVKLINQDLRNETEFDARFQREARIASQLADPHIVVVHDFGIDPTHGPFLVMEFLQGQSLRERLHTGGPLPLKAGLQLSAQLMLALIHAHSKNIVHRDIKPDNIFLLNQSGVRLHVRVLDFGIARIYRRDDAPGTSETITHAGAVLGTPRYMSPEQLAGQPVDARSDLYSAALVIHEALTGQLPYVGGKKLCEMCPEATQALSDLLDQCLRPNPAERPPTAVEVYLRLQELGKASGILLLPPGAMDRLVAARKANEPTVAYTPPDDQKRKARRWLLIAGALLALAGLAGLGWWLFFGGGSRKTGPESLLGVSIGDPQAAVADRLNLVQMSTGDPWKAKKMAGLLGHVLKPDNLGLPQEARGRLASQWTSDEKVLVIFHEEKVRAVVVQDRSGTKTGRGMKVPGDVSRMYKLYEEETAETKDEKLPGGGHYEVRRYDTAGIGFEVHGARVTAAALYPAKNP
jgi:serine/threonine-protein kinase